MRIEKKSEYSNNDNYSKENVIYTLYDDENKYITVFESRTKNLSPKGNVLFIPPYGVNAHSLYIFGYYFLANGYNVYRFDGMDSVGLGTGVIENYKLSRLVKDTEMVFDAFLKKSGIPTIIVCQSLSFPVGLNFLRNHEEIAPIVTKIIGVVGVVNVVDTIDKVANIECNRYLNKEPNLSKHVDVFGYDILAQDFLDDLQEISMTGFQAMNQIMSEINTPVSLISSTHDEYVNYEEVLQLCEKFKNKIKLISVEKAGHMIGRSISILKKMAVLALEAAAYGEDFMNDNIPPMTEIIKSASFESICLGTKKTAERSNYQHGIKG